MYITKLDLSEKVKQDADAKLINNNPYQRAGDYNKFNHMKKKQVNNYKNHFNEQVVIELVFLHIVQRTQYTPGGY